MSSAPVTVVEPPRGVSLPLRDLVRYRELLYFFVWRDVKVRYKQTSLGALWAILQPLVAMAIFTAIFGRFAKIPSDGVPYSAFVFAGLLPWTYFAGALTTSGVSVVGSTNLVTKVYFPRLFVPLAAVMVPLVDFALALVVLGGILAWHGIAPGLAVVALPLFVLLAIVTAFGVGLWLSALTVRYRDVPFALPFLTQVWMFATPVVYPLSIVPEGWRLLLSLNPLAGVVDGFRWALLDRAPPDPGVLAISATASIVVLLTGLAYFQRVERYFADVI